MYLDDIQQHIDFEKTEATLGPPKTIASKVVFKCVQCGNDKVITIKNIRAYAKMGRPVLCAKCSTVIRRETSRKNSKEFWEDPAKRQYYSEMMKEKFKDPNLKKRISESVSKAFQNPDLIERVRKNAIDRWQDPSYKEKTLEAINLKNQDPVYKENHSKASAALWQRSEFKEKMSVVMGSEEYSEKQRQVWYRPGYREDMISKQKEVWKKLGYKENILAKLQEIWNRPGYRENQSQKQAEFWSDPENRKKHGEIMSAVFSGDDNKSYKRTSIESAVISMLDSLSMVYEEQKPIGHYLFDLFIPSHNLLIEIQGEFWHSYPRSKSRDASKFTYIDEYFPDFRILYLYERDFRNHEIVKQKLIQELFDGDYLCAQNDFSFNNIIIKSMDTKNKLSKSHYSVPEEFLQSFHYAGFGRSAQTIYGAYLGDELIAICKFTPVFQKGVDTFIDFTPEEILELDRFCIHPQYQKKNFASWMISRCSKLIFEESPKIQSLISYVDLSNDHIRTMYEASNWIELHKTDPPYHYISPEGYVMYKKTVWNKAQKSNISEHDFVIENSYTKIKGKEKTKFMLNRF